jgi:predicted site-specific integrase-resolvase
MKVKLSAWAAKRYDPPPSDWVLRKWVRTGEIHPAPELVGKTYYVEDNARRLTGDTGRPSLVERLSA